MTCKYCGGYIPDAMVATGVHGGKDGCWNFISSELVLTAPRMVPPR